MTTRRRIRRLHREAERWYANGIHWEGGSKVAAPASGAMRIAFDAGRKAERDRRDLKPASFGLSRLPLEVWQQVLAEWLRSW